MRERRAGSARKQEIKVRLPVRLILQLQTLKVARGVLIASVVEEALRRYFAREVAAATEDEDAAPSPKGSA